MIQFCFRSERPNLLLPSTFWRLFGFWVLASVIFVVGVVVVEALLEVHPHLAEAFASLVDFVPTSSPFSQTQLFLTKDLRFD